MKICLKCRAEYPDSSTKCNVCGLTLVSARFMSSEPRQKTRNAREDIRYRPDLRASAREDVPAERKRSAPRPANEQKASSPRNSSSAAGGSEINFRPVRRDRPAGQNSGEQRRRTVPLNITPAPRSERQRTNHAPDRIPQPRRHFMGGFAAIMNILPAVIAVTVLIIFMITHRDDLVGLLRTFATGWIIGFGFIVVTARNFLQPQTMLVGATVIGVIFCLVVYNVFGIGTAVAAAVSPLILIAIIVLAIIWAIRILFK